MLRVDRSVTPTMAKAPTLGTWELELLRIGRRRGAAGPRRSVVAGRARADRRLGRRRRPTPWSSTAPPTGSSTRHWSRSGSPPRSRSSRCARASPASAPRSPATSRPPAASDDAAKNAICRTLALRQLAGRLGADERAGPAQLGRVQRRAGHPRLGQPGRPQPLPRPARPPGVASLDGVLGRCRPSTRDRAGATRRADGLRSGLSGKCMSSASPRPGARP